MFLCINFSYSFELVLDVKVLILLNWEIPL